VVASGQRVGDARDHCGVESEKQAPKSARRGAFS
jgi:hypothetical protein